MGHLLGHARVTTTDQQPQVDALERAGCYRGFTETASGARADHPTLAQLLDQLRPATPWPPGNSTASAAPCGTWSTPSPPSPSAASGSGACRRRSTPPPGGKLVLHVFAALAEFERDLIRERTAAGLAAARARGRHGGRPSVLSGHKARVAREMYRSGQCTVATIANILGVSRTSIYRHLDRAGG